MSKTRLEAFSDGVIAILITIMVLELKVPHGASWEALRPLLPTLLSYVLSFVYLGIYWNNHHHLLYACDRINGKILWANLHLMFWLSLVPAATAWVGDTHFAATAMALYGAVLLLAGIAFFIMTRLLVAEQGPDSRLARALASDTKSKLSLFLYATAIPLAFAHEAIAGAIYVLVALIWLVPDSRIEHHVRETA
jgi:uncharacterized membrane protein